MRRFTKIEPAITATTAQKVRFSDMKPRSSVPRSRSNSGAGMLVPRLVTAIVSNSIIEAFGASPAAIISSVTLKSFGSGVTSDRMT